MLLTISNDAKEVVVQVVIGDVEPQKATVAIINALESLPKLPKKRVRRKKPLAAAGQ